MIIRLDLVSDAEHRAVEYECDRLGVPLRMVARNVVEVGPGNLAELGLAFTSGFFRRFREHEEFSVLWGGRNAGRMVQTDPFLSDIICAALLGGGWRLIAEHDRKNSRTVRGRDAAGEEFDMHWAEDMSGSEQPPFRGFFRNMGSYNAQCDPVMFREVT